MNFIATPNPLKIAVIGGGISGMGAAYQLSKFGNVTLFEGEGRLGGHARTVFAGKRGDQAVDTGFIVFNKVTTQSAFTFKKCYIPEFRQLISCPHTRDATSYDCYFHRIWCCNKIHGLLR